MYNIYFRYLSNKQLFYFFNIELQNRVKTVDIPLSKVKIIFQLFKNDIFNRIAKN
jgi:hypothetical protein